MAKITGADDANAVSFFTFKSVFNGGYLYRRQLPSILATETLGNKAINTTTMIENFKSIIERKENEQVYQDFLEENTQFIPREFVQNHGIHLQLVLRKLSLSRDYTCDLFYLAKSSDDWNCVFIELEKPYSKFFKDGTNELHSDFIQGLDQIDRWRAWFQDQGNYNSFVNNTIGELRTYMKTNPCHIKYVLVTGRRNEFEKNEKRKSLIRAKERDDFKILSYDSLMESINLNYELFVGVRKNEYFEIKTKKYISDALFGWMEPENLRIHSDLKNEIIKDLENKILNSKSAVLGDFTYKTRLESIKKIKTIE